MSGPSPGTRREIEPFHVMEVLKAATRRSRTHGDVISLCAGQPSTPAPAAARAAAEAALASGDALGYTDALGMPSLREAIAEHYLATYGVAVSPGSVAVTTGSSAAFTAIFLAALDPGECVLMVRPGYPAYRNTLTALGFRVGELDAGPESRFAPDAASLEAWSRANETPRALIVASPANPTGTMLDADALADIVAWCEHRGVLLISDEIYHGITFGNRAPSALEFSNGPVVIGSVSKYYSMTGWRLGWAILPPALVRPVEILLGNLNICPPTISQIAAQAALGEDARAELARHLQRYRENRDLVTSRLGDLGITTWAPIDGAFYAYSDVSHLTDDSTAWCHEVLATTGVALTPGIDFAPPSPDSRSDLDGTRWMRLCFAGASADLDEAFNRLRGYVGT